MKTMILAAAAAVTFASPAIAREPLAQERYINDRLIAARIADEIRNNCPSLGGRLVYAWSQARALQDYALKKGYPRAEIEAYIKDKGQKKRLFAIADDYMARNGVRPGDAESYCRLGRQEMANGTVTGSLLVAK